MLPNQTLKPTRVFWFAPPFVRTNRLEVSRARLSLVSLDADAVSGFLQRFKDRYEIWRDEREAGPSGPRSGDKPPYRNPLLWGLFAAIVSLLPPCHIRSSIDLLFPAGAVGIRPGSVLTFCTFLLTERACLSQDFRHATAVQDRI